MVLSVDDWIETDDGNIGLVVDVSEAGRASGAVAVYFPTEVECFAVPVECVRSKFLHVLAPHTSL